MPGSRAPDGRIRYDSRCALAGEAFSATSCATTLVRGARHPVRLQGLPARPGPTPGADSPWSTASPLTSSCSTSPIDSVLACDPCGDLASTSRVRRCVRVATRCPCCATSGPFLAPTTRTPSSSSRATSRGADRPRRRAKRVCMVSCSREASENALLVLPPRRRPRRSERGRGARGALRTASLIELRGRTYEAV